ncbi:uncharacterized protein LOC143554672 [Bidens hawaiensis]|uniref:uncharacterized protein LOC143554672 n=1 Tax=Bidens hawaiensis TaxID=980011 RepID=UPI00404A761B
MNFWSDNWVGSTSLKEACPHLFKLEKNKRCKAKDRFWRNGGSLGWAWDWHRNPSSAQEMEEWVKIFKLMNAASWKEGTDSWEWLGDKDREFSVSSVKKMLIKNKDVRNNYVMRWCKWVPAKCNIHVWRVEMNRIPTRGALERRNLSIPSIECALCEVGRESADHITTGCFVSTIVWDHISRWCKIAPIYGFSVRDMLEFHKIIKLGEIEKEVFHRIIIIGCWRIWKARNEKVFEGKEVKVEEIIGDIKVLGFLWFNKRSKYRSVDWLKWYKFDFM